jgi:hypothetical protein
MQHFRKHQQQSPSSSLDTAYELQFKSTNFLSLQIHKTCKNLPDELEKTVHVPEWLIFALMVTSAQMTLRTMTEQ